MLDLTRFESGRPALRRSWESLDDLAAVALQRLGDKLARYRIDLDLPTDLAPVFVDASLIVQVFVNLLNNASKFTNDGGQLGFALRIDADMAEIDVSDNGIGIAPEMLPVIFDMFAQADESLQRPHAGLGVGLSLARQLVELHGGSMSLESEPGQGTRVTVRFPDDGVRPAEVASRAAGA